MNAEYTDWSIKLRENLWFHDGTPVLARAWIASASFFFFASRYRCVSFEGAISRGTRSTISSP